MLLFILIISLVIDTSSAVGTPLSAAEQTTAVDLHNKLRRRVAKGEETEGSPGPQPEAQNMVALQWDAGLATVAQDYAERCIFQHNNPSASYTTLVPGGQFSGQFIGENLAWGTTGFFDLPDFIETNSFGLAWYDEAKNYGFGDGFSASTGHYTQVIWATTTHIGCGRAECSGDTYLVCNYGPGGNSGGNPYITGTPCGACPTSHATCDDGLCSATSTTATTTTTRSPTTRAPTTRIPTTRAPTTRIPTTRAPTTRAPTTRAPTTRSPTIPTIPCTLNLDGSSDGIISTADLAILLVAWGNSLPSGACTGCPSDLDEDGFIGTPDLAALLVGWGTQVSQGGTPCTN